MIKPIYALVAAIALPLLISCNEDDSVSNMFEEVNGPVAEKLIASVNVVSSESSEPDRTVTINYASDDSVTSVTDGTQTALLVYDGGDLSQVNSEGDALNILELYESPLDAFEIGDIVSYDAAGNPEVLTLIQEEFDGSLTFFEATLNYDDRPNPTFFTLQAAGIIEVLDNVQLSFSAAPTPSEIVAARLLFPLNNPTGMAIRDESGAVVAQVTISHVYDDDNYPTTSTVAINSDEGDSGYILTYTYR